MNLGTAVSANRGEEFPARRSRSLFRIYRAGDENWSYVLSFLIQRNILSNFPKCYSGNFLGEREIMDLYRNMADERNRKASGTERTEVKDTRLTFKSVAGKRWSGSTQQSVPSTRIIKQFLVVMMVPKLYRTCHL